MKNKLKKRKKGKVSLNWTNTEQCYNCLDEKCNMHKDRYSAGFKREQKTQCLNSL